MVTGTILILLLSTARTIHGGNGTECRTIWHNVMLVNGICTECFPGYYGVNCTQHCPKGSYGKLCNRKCACTEDQFCHVVFGCIIMLDNNNNNTCYQKEVLERKWKLTTQEWFQISISLAVSNIVLLVISFVTCSTRRRCCSNEDYRPNQIIDLITRLTSGSNDRESIRNGELPGSGHNSSNQYVVQTSAVVNHHQPLSQTLSNASSAKPTTSFDTSEGEYTYMVPGTLTRDLSIGPSTSRGTANDDVGYNVLTLKTSISKVNSIDVEDGNGSPEHKGKGKGIGKGCKSKSKTLERLPGQSKMDRYHEHLVRHSSMKDPNYSNESFQNYNESMGDEYFILERSENATGNNYRGDDAIYNT